MQRVIIHDLGPGQGGLGSRLASACLLRRRLIALRADA